MSQQSQRWRFQPTSVLLLNKYFAIDPTPPKDHRKQLASVTGVSERQVRICDTCMLRRQQGDSIGGGNDHRQQPQPEESMCPIAGPCSG